MKEKKKLKYSFHDEPVTKFCYDRINKKIEVQFEAYFDEEKEKDIEIDSVWTIANWEYAESILGHEVKRYELEKHLGIFELINYMDYNDQDELELGVITIDNRYITLFFKNFEESIRPALGNS